MWTPSIDFIYGLAAGIGIWMCVEVIRVGHAAYQKRTVFNEAYDTILTALELHQQSIERLQLQLNQIAVEPGFNA